MFGNSDGVEAKRHQIAVCLNGRKQECVQRLGNEHEERRVRRD